MTHERKGGDVRGHFRNGKWVSAHYRKGTSVDRTEYSLSYRASPSGIQLKYYYSSDQLYGYLRDIDRNITYQTLCWTCGKPVFFYRNPNGGCAVFDELGKPWPIHICWLQLRQDSVQFAKQQFGYLNGVVHDFNTRLLGGRAALDSVIRLDELDLPYEDVAYILPEDGIGLVRFALTGVPGRFLIVGSNYPWASSLDENRLYRIRILEYQDGETRAMYIATPIPIDPPDVL